MPNKNQQSQLLASPFSPGRPLPEGRLLFGRESAVEQIRDVLGDAPVKSPLVICGLPGVGKTSLLHHLSSGVLGPDTCVLYSDFQSLETSSESLFLWQLAKSIMQAMEHQDFEGPAIEKRMLVLNPQLVFRQRFWNPLMSRAAAASMLFAWDNFDSLSSTSEENRNTQVLRAYLYELLETQSPVDLIFTITGRLEALAENTLAPFQPKRSLRLANLGVEQTIQLVRSSDQLPVTTSVAEFIANLTRGHPGDTQLICQTLFDRHILRHHGQVTVADVIAVLQTQLSPGDFVGDVYRRLSRTNTVSF